MNDYQNASFSDVAPSHPGSYEAYTPVSGCSSPSNGSQRMDPAEYAGVHPAAGSFHSVSVSLTPPPSATAPYFNMNLPSGMAAGPMAMVPGAASAQDLPSGYISSSSFPTQAPPATPDRHASVASIGSSTHGSSSHPSVAGSPVSPHHHHHHHHQHPMLTTSYSTDSVSSMGSMTSMSSVGYNGPATPDETSAYPFPEVHGSQKQHPHHHHHHQLPLPPAQPTHRQAVAMQQQQPSTYVFQGHDASDVSPSEFYWQTRNESPPLQNFFDEQQQQRSSAGLPLPPPSATLRSSVVKREGSVSSECIDAATGRRYSVASSGGGSSSSSAASSSVAYSAASAAAAAARRSLFVDHAQLRTEALQRSLGSGQPQQPAYGEYVSAEHLQQHHQQHHHHHHHHAQQQQPLPHHYHHGVIAPGLGGDIIIRNGIEVSKVASGAFKCLVAGCPARPFKRSEHLKRHVTTHHENKDLFPCEFCTRLFNRKDNWRSHLKLHTVVRGKNARTDYFPKAVRIYNEEMRKVSKSRPRKERV